ncbi:8-hydroxyquercetin 8-O-methyltransferase-like [Salvia splendens]|uniref:8-hydroxyquercetin 8-O-methyltransferase-like n=1 Tax=Salvia splendens TaxID=180675 RepID=UPI0011050D22|nr:8-hydroxyquercetin 8-O-methyltransferase-like [Salvia splendens]
MNLSNNCKTTIPKMVLPNTVVDSSTQELLEAQSHVWNLTFSFINSMCLKSALELGIPDAIHKHNKPITISELADALSIPKSKSHALFRLMRVLVHSKVFVKAEEDAYALTGTSRLLLEPLSFSPFALSMVDPIVVDPFHHVPDWFRDESSSVSPFVLKNGKTPWELAGEDEKWNRMFNDGMASDARLMGGVLVEKCKHVFQGLETVVDVAGGTGAVARAVSDAVPGLKCVVLDLPHVVAGLQDSENLRFVGGDMFHFIPPADAVILKWILHDWSDEDCIKILKNCKEAIISSKENGGKVIIVDMVVDLEKQEEKAIETQLYFDMLMMVGLAGKERTEKEWAKLFYDSGFQNYKITPILGLRSVIELFP